MVGTLETPSASSLARPVSPMGGAPGIPESKTSSSDVALRGKGKPIQCRLVKKHYESPDVLRLRFALPSCEQRLGLPVGMHIGLRAVVNGEKVMRQYTPVSDGDEKGHVELLIKVSKPSDLTAQMCHVCYARASLTDSHTQNPHHHHHHVRCTAPTSTRASPPAASCRSTSTACSTARSWTLTARSGTSCTRSPAASTRSGRTSTSSTSSPWPGGRALRPSCRCVFFLLLFVLAFGAVRVLLLWFQVNHI